MNNNGQQNLNNFQSMPYGQPMNNGYNPVPNPQGGYVPTQSNPTKPEEEKKDHSGLIKTVALVVAIILAVVFLGLFVYMYIQWNNASTDVQGQIDLAVAKAENEQQTKLENEFAEKEKYPYSTFTGPTDLGTLTFEYPKTWNLYIPVDGSDGSSLEAYFNPAVVNVVSDETVMALRLSIKTESTDEVKSDLADKVENGEMTVDSKVVNGVNVDVYHGKLDSDYVGYICVFKLRDKTVTFQTDAELFKNDFDHILSTIRYVK